jgi:hypothetical protein
MRKTAKSIKQFKKKYFVLQNQTLYVYETQGDFQVSSKLLLRCFVPTTFQERKEAQEAIFIGTCNVANYLTTKDFLLENTLIGLKASKFQALNKGEADTWIHGIQKSGQVWLQVRKIFLLSFLNGFKDCYL